MLARQTIDRSPARAAAGTPVRARCLALLLVSIVAVPDAAASDGVGSAWTVWSWPPLASFVLTLLVVLYTRGLMRLWSRAGVGRGVASWRVAAFGTGVLVLVLALHSPVAFLSETLLSVHMVQHLLLLLVAPPLLIAGMPLFVLLWALPERSRKSLAVRWRRTRSLHASWEAVSQPLVVWAIYALVLWAWHLPALYETALQEPFVHELQHVGFAGSAMLLWWTLLNPMGRLRLNRGAGVLYVFTTSLHATALGVFVTLSPRPWYGHYAETTAQWNLTPLEDQQLAGALMWMPACLVYIALAGLLFALWLRESERRDLLWRRISSDGTGRRDALLRAAEEDAA